MKEKGIMVVKLNDGNNPKEYQYYRNSDDCVALKLNSSWPSYEIECIKVDYFSSDT